MTTDKITMREFGLSVAIIHDLASAALLRHPGETITAAGYSRDHGNKVHFWYNTPDGSTHVVSVRAE
jgi:hypothetical protein